MALLFALSLQTSEKERKEWLLVPNKDILDSEGLFIGFVLGIPEGLSQVLKLSTGLFDDLHLTLVGETGNEGRDEPNAGACRAARGRACGECGG